MGLKSAKILFNKPSSQRWDASDIVRRKASANFYLFDTVVPFFNSLSEFRISPRDGLKNSV